MQKREVIFILIIVVLIIILSVSIWYGRTATQKVSIDCQKSCIKDGRGKWLFPGNIPVSQNKFSTKEDCISACQKRFQK